MPFFPMIMNTETGSNGQQHDRSAIVLYGSETGNAQDVADELGRITERLHFLTHVSNLDAIEPSSLPKHKLVIFAVSTTGQGDLPSNARSFWKSLLRKKLPPTYLEHVQFTTFGLGDSSYPKFNWAARKLHKRLSQLGANEIYPRGEADDQHPEGLDASFLPWSIDLRQHLLVKFPLAQGIDPIPEDVLLHPKWLLSFAEDPQTNSVHSNLNGKSQEYNQIHDILNEKPQRNLGVFSNGKSNHSRQEKNSERLTVTLEKNGRITPSTHWQDVRHLIFTSPSTLSYAPGDILTLYPKNQPEDVNRILEIMDWASIADKTVFFVPTGPDSGSNLYPSQPVSVQSGTANLSLRTILTEYLDLNALPRRSFFSLISHFTVDKMQKERLLEFTNPDYLDELYDYTTRSRRSILEVLQEFSSVKIPWQWVASVLPELRGRQFSIASGGQLKSGGESEGRCELLVAIVKYKTVIKKIREGVCTRYIAGLLPGIQMNVTLQKGGLGITKAEARRPVVMIGPGTGIAPMRSLIWERVQWAEEWKLLNKSNGVSLLGESVLFFGCRNRNADFFFESEWESIQDRIPLKVFSAFSRDQKEKIYVQDLLIQQCDLVFRLLYQSGGIVYICGSSGKMPLAVREALIEVFQKGGRMERGDAEAYLQAMEKQGRYKQETW